MAYTTLSRTAFDRLLTPIYPALLRQAAYRVGWQQAKDCVQSALLCAWQAIERYNPDTDSAGLFLFLRCYVRYACAEYIRQSLRRGEVLIPTEEALRLAEAGQPPEVSGAAYESLREQMFDLLCRIPLTSLQEQSIHRWLEGWTQNETAQYLQISQSMVGQHIQAGAARLRNAWLRENPSPTALRDFSLGVDEQYRRLYRKPAEVWDREGNQEERLRRARLFALQDERERFEAMAAPIKGAESGM